MKRALIKWTTVVCTAVLSVAYGQQAPTPAQTQEANLKAYTDLLRKDVKKQKVAIVTELMDLTPEESSKFWPVYNEFDKALTNLQDEKLALIRMYSENYSSMTGEMATKLAMGMLDLEGKRNDL